MRSGYSESGDLDQKDLAMWRGRVASAMRGNRGQQLLKDALAALDAMPVKRLIKEKLVVSESGDVCTLGAVAPKRGVADINEIDPEDHDTLGKRFNVAPCLIQEIEYENDEAGPWNNGNGETPEQRFERVRKWLVKNIKATV